MGADQTRMKVHLNSLQYLTTEHYAHLTLAKYDIVK